MTESSASPAVTLITLGAGGGATGFRRAVGDTADRYVRSRLAPVGEEPASQVITEFAPAPGRPASYPAWLPFLPGRPVFTTESPSGAVSPGARWPCGDDADAVAAALAEQSAAAGWAPRPAGDARGTAAMAGLRAELVRGDRVRRLLVARTDSGAIVQLLEGPAAWFYVPPA